MKLPNEINILGKTYKISYVDTASHVDIHKRYSYEGQVDFWTYTIRILVKDPDTGLDCPQDAIFQTLTHEIFEVISAELHIESFGRGYERKQTTQQHEDLDKVATAFADTLQRNGWLK